MSNETTGAASGYVGAMPLRRGEFSDGLPQSFVDPWREWLALALERSRAQLGDGWLDTYLTSPVWYFGAAPGLCGEGAWAGVMMPSVDEVGHYFPLVVASPVPSGECLFEIMGRHANWFEHAESLARSCLEEDFSLEDFAQRLKQLQPLGGHAMADAGPGPVQDSYESAWCFGLQSMDGLASSFPHVLHRVLQDLLLSYSLWWSPGSELVEPTLLISQGLPPSSGYAAMLDGDWSRWGWDARHVVPLARPG